MHRFTLIVAAIACVLGSTSLVAENNGNPPFKSGEIAVYASPADLPGYQVKKYLPNAGISVVQVQSGKEWGQIQKLRAKGKRAGLNLIASASATVNDEFYSFQWHLPAIQSEQAWDITNGAGAVVAVLDTGLSEGTDGVNCVVSPTDVVNGDSTPQDEDGHGTHVSGTIAQTSNNGVGTAGVAYGACIMPVKVLGADGNGSFADISDGIYYAVNNGAHVINMSLGTTARYKIMSDPVMDAALDYAYNNGVTVFAATGNDGNRRNAGYPATYTTTIGVGATDYRNSVTRYSNQGTGLDIMAPGGDTGRDDNGDSYGDGVLQETHDGAGSYGFYFFQGTSMATPHAAGVAALLVSAGVATTPDEIYAAMTGTALDLGESGFDNKYGHGLIQAYAALTGDTGGPVDPPPGGGDDVDGDGYTVADGDCDDNNASVFPGANDTRGKKGRDGIDNDCNGIIDG
ncbi:MAG: S8 family serine peptidase [bacterium]